MRFPSPTFEKLAGEAPNLVALGDLVLSSVDVPFLPLNMGDATINSNSHRLIIIEMGTMSIFVLMGCLKELYILPNAI